MPIDRSQHECARCNEVFLSYEYCWSCHARLCKECWEKYGHCGHAEIDNMDKERNSPIKMPTMFLDKGLHHLKNGLEDCGFKTVILDNEMPYDKIKELIKGCMVLTTNEFNFMKDAKAFGYSVFSIRRTKEIDDDETCKNITAKKISLAIKGNGNRFQGRIFWTELYDYSYNSQLFI